MARWYNLRTTLTTRIHSLRLPYDFDPDRLKRDLAQVQPDEWVAHFNQSDYEGNWSGVALRSVDGSVQRLVVHMSGTEYIDTPLLARTPYLQEVLSKFAFPMTSVRLLSLHPGSIIKEHSDPALQYEEGEIRLHIPVQTSPDVHFYLDGRRVTLAEGETWYLDLSQRHRIENHGTTDRVHLVIDGHVNDWVHSVFKAAIEDAGGLKLPPLVVTPFHRFREIVFDDAGLQEQLLATPDRASFIETAVRLGRERGYDFDANHVESAILLGQKGWNERWKNA